MKKVRESLNEENQDMKRIYDINYRRVYKEAKDYCKSIIDESGQILERIADEGASRDEDEGEMTAKHEGRIEVAQNIMEILRNL